MQQITTVGLDIAKNLFQVHGADAQGRPVLRRKLARGKVLEFFTNLPPCLVGLEACAAAHYWARELAKLGHRGAGLDQTEQRATFIEVEVAVAPDQKASPRCNPLGRSGIRISR